MSKTSILTLRLPQEVRLGVERLAAQTGHKPAQIGARLIEEGLRRRDFPQIELRDTAAGRVAYLKGTRLAVYWIVLRVRDGVTTERIAEELEVSPVQLNAALAYAQAFASEIEMDIGTAAANGRWLELQEAAWQKGRPGNNAKGKTKSQG